MLKFDLQKVKIIFSTSWFFPLLFEIKILELHGDPFDFPCSWVPDVNSD